MSLKGKYPEASNENMFSAPPSVPTCSTGTQFADHGGNPISRGVDKPTSTNNLENTGTLFNEDSDELPPAYEAVATSSSQISPQVSSPQVSSPRVNSSFDTTQTPSKPEVVQYDQEHGQKHDQVAGSSGSQLDGDTRGQNVNTLPERAHIPVSADSSTYFQRTPPKPCDLITYERLPRPFVIQGGTSKHQLPDLFPATGIPALSRHDVQASDWENFIQDLTACARYSTGQQVVAGTLPVVRRFGPPGALISAAAEKGMRRGKLSSSLALLDTWNVHFFNPRRLEVVLCKGDKSMIIDSIVPQGQKSRAIAGVSLTASDASPQTTRSVDQPLFHTEPNASSSSRTSGDSIPTARSFVSAQNSSGNEPSEPPPAYETVVTPSAPNATRRTLKRSAHRSSCASSQQSGDSRDYTITSSESWETMDMASPLRPVPKSSDLFTFEKLPRPFVIQAKTSKHKLPDLFSSVGTPALPRHDVQESDWEDLLQKLAFCSRYSTGQRIVASVLPVTKCLGPPGCLANFAIEQGMRRGRLTKSLALLDTWNETFFKPRRLEIILCKGDKCKSGKRTGFLAPDRTNLAPKRGQNLPLEPTDEDYRLVVISI